MNFLSSAGAMRWLVHARADEDEIVAVVCQVTGKVPTEALLGVRYPVLDLLRYNEVRMAREPNEFPYSSENYREFMDFVWGVFLRFKRTRTIPYRLGFFCPIAASKGGVIMVVTTAIRTMIVNSEAVMMPSCRPMLSSTSSTVPLAFIGAQNQAGQNFPYHARLADIPHQGTEAVGQQQDQQDLAEKQRELQKGLIGSIFDRSDAP
jgi:hypothetical protein